MTTMAAQSKMIAASNEPLPTSAAIKHRQGPTPPSNEGPSTSGMEGDRSTAQSIPSELHHHPQSRKSFRVSHHAESSSVPAKPVNDPHGSEGPQVTYIPDSSPVPEHAAPEVISLSDTNSDPEDQTSFWELEKERKRMETNEKKKKQQEESLNADPPFQNPSRLVYIFYQVPTFVVE